MTLAQSIAADRQRLGMSQAELATRLGVSQQSVSKWEEGKSVPRGKRMHQLVATLGNTSQTAISLGGILSTSNTYKEDAIMGAALPPSSGHEINSKDALAALAQAAQELAKAARAIANAVEQMASRPPPHH